MDGVVADVAAISKRMVVVLIPDPFAALRVVVKEPACLGMPEIIPLLGSDRYKPGGKPVAEKVAGTLVDDTAKLMDWPPWAETIFGDEILGAKPPPKSINKFDVR